MQKNKLQSPTIPAQPIETLQQLFDLAGSSTKLAALLDRHAFTIENWRRSGIPQRYWDRLNDLFGLSPAELYNISKNCRRDRLK